GINEIPCSAPVMLTGDFFLGYTITYSEENCDTFAVKMSVSKENRIETMYGKYIAAWYPISELIPQTKYSLAISPKLCTGNVNNPDYFIVFPSILQLKNIKGASGRIGVWTDLGKWEVANKPDWLDILADYGTGTLYVYTTSTSAKPRQANLTITVNGKSQNVQISQFKGAATEDLSSVNCKIYPNPSSTGLYSIELPMSTLYSIMDISGRVLCSGKIGSSVETIDLSSYNSGMYFIRFKDGNGYRVDKLIKK
ncbi:MAG: T9SS type A sorting domain-containing protein, partial [Bacteroidales bacterium]